MLWFTANTTVADYSCSFNLFLSATGAVLFFSITAVFQPVSASDAAVCVTTAVRKPRERPTVSSELCCSVSLEDLMVLESSARPLTRDTHRKLRHVHILPRLTSPLLITDGWPSPPAVSGVCLSAAALRCVCFYTCLPPLICLSALRCLDAAFEARPHRNAAAFASFLEASGEMGAFET